MYTKQEASAIRQQFWTTLGQYLAPINSASGEKVNWINYKTQVKGIQIKMDAQPKYSFVAIEIRGEEEKRIQFFQMFQQFRDLLPENYEWIENCEDEQGKSLSRIYCELEGPNLFNKDHWPELISFFKANILQLDEFWTTHKDFFELAS